MKGVINKPPRPVKAKVTIFSYEGGKQRHHASLTVYADPGLVTGVVHTALLKAFASNTPPIDEVQR